MLKHILSNKRSVIVDEPACNFIYYPWMTTWIQTDVESHKDRLWFNIIIITLQLDALAFIPRARKQDL